MTFWAYRGLNEFIFMNILFTCTGRRKYLLDYFRDNLNPEDIIVATDMQFNAPALTSADIKVKVPAVYDPYYIDITLDICKRHDIKGIIPLNDLELPILTANVDRFLEIGCRPVVSSPEVIDFCFDKLKTAEFIQSIGLRSPKTLVSMEEAVKALNNGELSFPLVLKPRWGSGSIGIEFVNNLIELKETYALLMLKVKKSILGMVSVGDEFILIQEKIDGQEFGLDVMNDFEGSNHGVSVKKKLAMRAGETDKAVTVDYPEMIELGKIIASNLRHIGNLDVDVFEKNGELFVLEMNPRFGGGFPFSYEAGVNFPKAIIEWLKGNKIDDSILLPRYGEAFAKCDHLVCVPSPINEI